MQSQTKNLNQNQLSGNWFTKLFKHENVAILCVFIIYIVVVSLINPNFISAMNIRNVLVQVSIIGVLSVGMLFVMLTGGIDLSVAWMMTFFGCVTSYLVARAELNVALTMLIVFLGCIGGQALMGFIITRTKMEPFIISLGFMSIYTSLTYLLTDGSEIPAAKKFEWLNQFPGGLSTLVYIFAAVVVVAFLILKFTKFGRRLYAVGCNSDAAYLSGVDVKNFKTVVYMVNGFLIALAAIMQVARLNTASPSMSTGNEISAIAACVVGGTALSGGKGNMIGVFIGILLLGCIKNSMTIMGINPYISDLFKGIIIIVSVIIGQAQLGKKNKNN